MFFVRVHPTRLQKLFEYLAARRPIVGVGTGEGAMAGVLKETGSGHIFDWDDSEGISKYIDSLWEAFKRGEVMTPDADIEKYSRRMTTKKMAELFDTLVHKNTSFRG